MRIIGIELRLKYFHPRYGYQQKEIAIIPCDVELSLDQEVTYSGSGQCMMNATLHTDGGDIGVNDFSVPFPFESKHGLNFKQRT
jgi:hypothetical protein